MILIDSDVLIWLTRGQQSAKARLSKINPWRICPHLPKPVCRSSAKIIGYDFVLGNAMPAISPKGKQRAAPFKTSALESARRAGIAGVFDGPPDLAANRKKYLKEKLHGKARNAN